MYDSGTFTVHFAEFFAWAGRVADKKGAEIKRWSGAKVKSWLFEKGISEFEGQTEPGGQLRNGYYLLSQGVPYRLWKSLEAAGTSATRGHKLKFASVRTSPYRPTKWGVSHCCTGTKNCIEVIKHSPTHTTHTQHTSTHTHNVPLVDFY